jgi:hypothetical protein
VPTKIRLLTLFLTLLPLQPTHSLAQTSAQNSCDVPLVVFGWNRLTQTGNVLLKDLHPEDLLIQIGSEPGTAESLSLDHGPKRVVLILDASRNVPDEEWNLETEMAARFVHNARPNDKFVLLLEGSDSGTAPVVTPTEAIRQLSTLRNVRPVPAGSEEPLYDVLQSATQRVDPPAFGDAIVFFGHPEDSGSKIDPDQLLQILLKNGLRLFGFSYRDPLEGKLTLENINKPLPPNLKALVDSKFDDMSHQTGYFLSYRSIRSVKQPRQYVNVEMFMDDVYARVAEPYRLKLRMPTGSGPIRLRIEVVDAKNRVPRADDVAYPHSIYPCLASSDTMR